MAWIFRSSEPVAERLRSAASDEWLVKQHRSLMSPGDLIFFWESDAGGRFVGVGRIQTQPYRSKNGGGEFRVRAAHNLVLKTPLTEEECRADGVLATLSVLRRDHQLDYGLSRAQTDRLLAYFADREAGLAEALNMRRESLPQLVGRESRAPAQEHSAEFAAAARSPEQVLSEELARRVEAFRGDPAVAKLHALRTAAYDRLREVLTPAVLAEMTADRFDREVVRFGGVIIDGEPLTLAEGIERLRDVSLGEVERMIRAGAIRTEGNLTWCARNRLVVENASEQDRNAISLRLRAGLAHLLAGNRPLAGRIDRMRRSVDALWPESATGILMILRPDEHIVYHRRAVRALEILGVGRTFRSTFDDYQRYRQFVAQIGSQHGIHAHALVDLFLSRVAEPEWPARG